MTAPRAVRVPLATPYAPGTSPSVTDVRRGRLRALSALVPILARDGLESIGEPVYSTECAADGHWYCTALVQVHPATWRTERIRSWGPCAACGSRNKAQHRDDAGEWHCDDAKSCARRVHRARRCDLCGVIGTPYSIARTPGGLYACKDAAACESAAVTTTIPAGVMPAKR